MQPPSGSEGTSAGCCGGSGGTMSSVATPTRSACTVAWLGFREIDWVVRDPASRNCVACESCSA